MNQTMIRIHAVITGRVQGVNFRRATQERAEQLQLTGWARNLAAGGVEVEAQGSNQNIEAFSQWMYQGPLLARVDQVEITILRALDGESGFTILATT